MERILNGLTDELVGLAVDLIDQEFIFEGDDLVFGLGCAISDDLVEVLILFELLQRVVLFNEVKVAPPDGSGWLLIVPKFLK